MDVFKVMEARHSVRQYEDRPIEEEVRRQLDDYVKALNEESGLHMQIFYDEPECFDSGLAHYGRFENVNNYIAIVGKKSKSLDETAGYYGELLVLKAQELGLNTCWVALTHGKSKTLLDKDEKEVIIIALGHGSNQGTAHRNKPLSRLVIQKDGAPKWFDDGVRAALLAPTATNQQKFRIALNEEDEVILESTGIGPCLKIDLGIVKCHFELGAGKDNFKWA